MKMDVSFLFTFLVTVNIWGVMSLSPIMQNMNADVKNLRRKIRNQQAALSNKGNAIQGKSMLPAAEIALQEFLPSSDGITPVDTQKSKKKKSQTSNKGGSPNDITIPDVPAKLKNVGVSNTDIVPIETKSMKSDKSSKKSHSKKITKTKSKDASQKKPATDPSNEPASNKSGTADSPVVKVTTTSTSRSKRRSRRRSSRRRSSKRSRKNTTPSPTRKATQAPPTTEAYIDTISAHIQTTPTPALALATTPKQSMQTPGAPRFTDGPMAMVSALAQMFPQLLRLLGGIRSQGSMIGPNMEVLMNEGGFFNPAIPRPMFSQGHTSKQSDPTQHGSAKTLKQDFPQRTPMQMYMERELCSETPSKLVKMCKTRTDCQHKMECYSGYCCANSHRHAEMLDNMAEYMEMPRRERSWRSFHG